MNCKEIQEWLLTEDADEPGDPPKIKALHEHLAACQVCREYRRRLQTGVLQPLRKALKATPPESVWLNIKESILDEQARRAEQPNLLLWIKHLLFPEVFYKPALASLVALGVIIAFLSTYLPYQRNRQIVYNFIGDQEQSLAYLSGDSGSAEDGIDDFGTTVEEFLL